MLTLINTNRMQPPIAPIGVDYVAAAARAAGIETDVVDLCLADDPAEALGHHFASRQPVLVAMSFRNVDDSFYPSMQSFLPHLREVIGQVRRHTDAPIVLGGAGYSIFAGPILERTGAEFGIRGDGEGALVTLVRALQGGGSLEDVPGLVWRRGATLCANRPAWPEPADVPVARDAVDNATYLRRGGQIGLETKRGCGRGCIFCADPLAKGHAVRCRPTARVADEVEALLAQGIDVLHLCDAEFNIPYGHAMAVCEELTRRGLGERVRWYAYLSVVPFDEALAVAMRRAGCVGINFTGPAASDEMLTGYRQPHRPADLAAAVRACRAAGITVMVDLMLGGPGETPATLAAGIGFVKSLPVDCVGAGLGVRLYPGLPILNAIAAEAPIDINNGIRRRYAGPIDLVQPTFYVSPALGDRPAALVRQCIGGDDRFFPPADEGGAAGDHNYNDNNPLAAAIAAGARGAYWDILRRLQSGQA